MTPAQRAYEPAPDDTRALRALTAAISAIAGGAVEALGVGTWRDGAEVKRADQVLVSADRDVLDVAVAAFFARGYVLLGAREDDGEVWAWFALRPGAVAWVVDVPRPATRRVGSAAAQMARSVAAALRGFGLSARQVAAGFAGIVRVTLGSHPMGARGRHRRRAGASVRHRPASGPGPPGFRSSAVTSRDVEADWLCGFVWEGIGDGDGDASG